MTTYQEKLKDPRWQKCRLEVFERDDWMCQFCCSITKTLEVHHKEYLSGLDPWDYPLSNFITLCEDCHKKVTQRNASIKDHTPLTRKELEGRIIFLNKQAEFLLKNESPTT